MVLSHCVQYNDRLIKPIYNGKIIKTQNKKNLAIKLNPFGTVVNNIILRYLVFSALEMSFSSKNKSKVGYT